MRLLRSALLLGLFGAASAALAQSTSFYVEPGSYSTARETEPPAYVRNLGQAGHPDLDWLDLGLQQRLRYEYRDDDIRRPDANGLDDPWLARTRVFVGIRNRIDPLRMAFEFQDSRRYDSRFAPDNRDVNEKEFIQGYAELYFAAALAADSRGNARPLSLRYGRHAFELLDRRFVGRNEWRNTTNTFEGLRGSIGQDSNDWQLEFMSFHPLTRLLENTDRVDRNQRFSAVVGHWRRSPRFTLEPHYFHLKQHASLANGNRAREIHAPGLRVYGRSPDTAVNYDVSAIHQFGDEGVQDHEAWSFTAEAGYTWLQHPWRPRLSAFYGYASGDRNPGDSESNRFERFFGFARPWSASDYVIYENIRAPKLRLEFQPIPGVRVDAGYGAYWLASSKDRFNNLMGGSGNRDTAGRSGSFVGQEFDARVRFAVGQYLDVTLGYSHFANDEFVRNRQRARLGASEADSDFVYVELMLSLF